MQRQVASLADVQLDPHWCDGFEQIARHERRDALIMIKVMYRWQLAVITRKYHKVVVERNAAYDVQEGIFHHEKFVKYQRAFEKTVLDPVLQPAQGLPMIELRTRHMSPRTDDGVVHKLKDSLEQIRLPCSWRADK